MKKIVEIPDDLNGSIDRYQKANGCTFTWLVRTSIERYLKEEGFIDNDSDEKSQRILQIVEESGLTVEEFEECVSQALEGKVCHG